MAGISRTCEDLLRELRTSTWLPHHNDAGVEKALREIEELYASTQAIAALPSFEGDDDSSSLGPTFLAAGVSINRARQCLLAHGSFRLSKIIALRWASAGALPQSNRAFLSAHEAKFAEDYDGLLADYMSDPAVGGLDLTNGLLPPKSLFIEVAVTGAGAGDVGSVVLPESGQSLSLIPHERHFLRQADAEPLIRQGLLAHCHTGR